MIMLALSLATGNLYAGDISDAQDASEKFSKKASISSLFEIESSKVALDRSKNPQIKKLATKLIEDHTASNKKLKDLLTKEKLRFPMNMTLDETHAEKVNDLKETSEDEFDREYMDMQHEGHENTIDVFKDFLDAKDTHPAVRSFAEQTLPALKMHLEEINRIKKEL
jgi:putative membrane protein